MAELQRLLQSIQEGKVPMPPGLLNLISFDQNQVPVINLSPASASPSDTTAANHDNSPAGFLVGGHPSPVECDSGYTSMKDTPGSSQSESPVAATLLPQVPTTLEQRPSPRGSVSTQQSLQSQYSAQYSPPSNSVNYSAPTPLVNQVSPLSDMGVNSDAIRSSIEYDRKPDVHHLNQNTTNAKRSFAQVDNYQNHSSSPSLDNLNCMNEVLSHLKQEQMSPESCLNVIQQDSYTTQQNPTQQPQDNVAFNDQNKHAIKQELESQMISLQYKEKSPSPEVLAASAAAATQAPGHPGSGACNTAIKEEKTSVPSPCTRYRSSAPPRSIGAVGSLLNDAKAVPRNEKEKLVENVTQTVIEAHMDTCNWTADKIAAGLKKFKENGPGEMPKDMVSKILSCFAYLRKYWRNVIFISESSFTIAYKS